CRVSSWSVAGPGRGSSLELLCWARNERDRHDCGNHNNSPPDTSLVTYLPLSCPDRRFLSSLPSQRFPVTLRAPDAGRSRDRQLVRRLERGQYTLDVVGLTRASVTVDHSGPVAYEPSNRRFWASNSSSVSSPRSRRSARSLSASSVDAAWARACCRRCLTSAWPTSMVTRLRLWGATPRSRCCR